MSSNIKNIGVLVTDTMVSKTESDTGKLLYRGFNASDLVVESTFEEVVYLLLYGSLPTMNQLDELIGKMRSFRELPAYLLKHLKDLPHTAPMMSVITSSITLIECYERMDVKSEENYRNIGVKMISLLPTIISYWYRMRNGLRVIEPSNLNHAANFFRMLFGELPKNDYAKILDECLVLLAEHSLNASTLVAREVTSTGGSIYSSIAAAIGALSGELQGGASSKVMEMFEEIGEVKNVEKWIKKKLDGGERIAGLGSKTYRDHDPRAKIFKERVKRLAVIRGDLKRLDITQRIEQFAIAELERSRGLKIIPNEDLYSASIYELIGIPKELFCSVFAMARSAGLCAHIIEEKFAKARPQSDPYRPKPRYIGNYCGPEERSYTNIDER